MPAHPANVHRLLYDEGQLVLVFPEGRKGTEKLYKDRYRLRRFGRGGFVEAAMRARAPIVPIAVVGAEEAAPIFAQRPALQRLTGLLYFPITPTFPHFGLLGMLGYLPAKFTIRFLPPVPTDDLGDEPWEDKALVQTVAHDIRATIQDELLDMLGQRAQRLVRMSSRRILSPACRPTGAVASRRRSNATRRRGDHRRRRRPPKVELRAHRVRARHRLALAHPPRSSRRPRSTRWSTRGWSSTRSSPRRASPTRTTSSGTMNVLAACGGQGSPVRKVVFKSSAHYYGCERDDPAFFTEAMPARTRRARRSSATSSRPRRAVREFACATRTSR